MRADLRVELLSALERARLVRDRRRRVFALMRELQVQWQSTNVKGKDGKALVWASEIARVFKEF